MSRPARSPPTSSVTLTTNPSSQGPSPGFFTLETGMTSDSYGPPTRLARGPRSLQRPAADGDTPVNRENDRLGVLAGDRTARQGHGRAQDHLDSAPRWRSRSRRRGGCRARVTDAPAELGRHWHAGAMAAHQSAGSGPPHAARRSRSPGRRPPGREDRATGRSHRGVDQLHGAHRRLVLLEGQALCLQCGRGRGRVVQLTRPCSTELPARVEARALGRAPHLGGPHEQAVRGEEERVGRPAGVEDQARVGGVRTRPNRR